MTIEIILVYAVVVWFYIELWKNFSHEGLGKHMRVFFMMIAYIHVVTGTLIMYQYSKAEAVADLTGIFLYMFQFDIILLLLTFIIYLVAYTDKGRKVVQYVVDRF